MRTCPDCLGTGEMPEPADPFELSRCPTCEGAGAFPGTDVVIHPDSPWLTPYGLLSARQVYAYLGRAEGYREGYNAAIDDIFCSDPMMRQDKCHYAELRDYLMRLADMPYEVACMIALWMTRDSAKMHFLSFTIVF